MGVDLSTIDVAAIAAGGTPLDPLARKTLEKQFGADLSAIVVHSDAQASAAVARTGAPAFTYQNHIFFAPGMYRPQSHEGLALLSHEVTHFLQGGRATGLPTKPAPLDQGGPHEAEADAAAHHAMAAPVTGTQSMAHLTGSERVPVDLSSRLPTAEASMEAAATLGQSGFQVRERADSARVHRCIGGCTPSQPARQPPTLQEILADGTVHAELEAAWTASHPDAPDVQRGQQGSIKMEQNGWIMWNPQTGAFSVMRLNNGLSERDSFTMTDRPTDTDTRRVVAFYHTHPNKNSEGYVADPSDADRGVADWARLPGIIRTHEGIKTFGEQYAVRR